MNGGVKWCDGNKGWIRENCAFEIEKVAKMLSVAILLNELYLRKIDQKLLLFFIIANKILSSFIKYLSSNISLNNYEIIF